jgi:hypothetical protein
LAGFLVKDVINPKGAYHYQQWSPCM